MPWWRRSEKRARDMQDYGPDGPESYSELEVGRLFAQALGVSTRPEALAAVETCVGTWERAIGSATLASLTPAARAVTPEILSLAGRTLALTGEIVFLIEVEDGMVRLLPASGFNVMGGASPASWAYHLSIPSPSGTYSRNAAADTVVHFRIGASTAQPWRGRGPLQRATSTASLSAAVEDALAGEAALPSGRIAPYFGTPEQTGVYARNILKGGFAFSTQGGGRADQDPASRWKPQVYQPDPSSDVVKLRENLAHAIMSVFGLSPALFDPAGTGTAQREAWRRAWSGTFAPIAASMASEIARKLDTPGAVLSLEGLRAADDQAQARSIGSRAQALTRLVEAKIPLEEARRLVGLE